MIIFLHGPDNFRSRRKLNEIIKRYRERHQSGLNFSRLYAPEVKDFSDFKNRLEALSMFEEKRFLLAENVFETSWAENWHAYISSRPALLEQQSEITVFYEDKKVDRKKELFSLLAKTPVLHEEFNPLTGTQLSRWIKKEAMGKGLEINEPLIQKLIFGAGSDLWQISNELEKLAAFSGNDAFISGNNTPLKIFDALDALAEKNKSRALDLFHQHLAQGENELGLLSMVAYQLRNLIKIKDLTERGVPYYKMKEMADMAPFVFQKSNFQAKKFTAEELKKLYQGLAELDRKIKTGRINPRLALESLIFSV